MATALFLNGMYEDILESILAAQETRPGTGFYLQPYSTSKIKMLADVQPTWNSPATLYLSTTKTLGEVAWEAKIVGWQDKRTLAPPELNRLNESIRAIDDNLEAIYLDAKDGKACVNLILITELKRLLPPLPVKALTKVADNTPLKVKTTAGGWSYVEELPERTALPTLEEICHEQQRELEQSLADTSEQRQARLAEASPWAEKVLTTAWAYRRNQDVVAQVLVRAQGKCECCGKDAPFLRASNGRPYLEVHHAVPLASGGPDTVENAEALCPNCHREKHYGQPAAAAGTV